MYDWPKNVAHPRILYPRLAKTRHKHKMDKTKDKSHDGEGNQFVLCHLFFVLLSF